MAAYSSRARAALVGLVALIVATAVALVVHEPTPSQTVSLSESAPTTQVPASDEPPTTTKKPTTTSTTASTSSTAPSTTAPPPTTATAPPTTEPHYATVTAPPPTIGRAPRVAPRKYVDCQYLDQGNQLGQMQMITVSSPALAGQRVSVAYYYPADSQASTGSRFTDLDANGNGNITFETTPEMVGNPVRLEGYEDMSGTSNSSDMRWCQSALFTIPPPS